MSENGIAKPARFETEIGNIPHGFRGSNNAPCRRETSAQYGAAGPTLGHDAGEAIVYSFDFPGADGPTPGMALATAGIRQSVELLVVLSPTPRAEELLRCGRLSMLAGAAVACVTLARYRDCYLLQTANTLRCRPHLAPLLQVEKCPTRGFLEKAWAVLL